MVKAQLSCASPAKTAVIAIIATPSMKDLTDTVDMSGAHGK